MINIAHISDIHFGSRFSGATWAGVVDTIATFDPHLIVVSGDVVDDPAPAHLLAAKCGLSNLLQETHRRSDKLWGGVGRRAELIVVAGNHDVYESGVSFGMRRLDWFERIFHGANTVEAEKALKAKLSVANLDFNPACLGYPAKSRPGFMRKTWSRLHAMTVGRFILQDFTTHLGAPQVPSRVHAPASSPVLLALLDSNPAQAGFHAATGVVENDELVYLQLDLRNKKEPYVARVAIVHHHVLPIAFASGAAGIAGEPMMVLRNAGAVLQILADNKFDLVLHGHWHKSQFARIDFGSDTGEGYPMAVVSAGSAAMSTPDNTGANSLNLITISPIGRIEVKCVDYGAAQLPKPNGAPGKDYRSYREPLSAAKRRAYIRARERHPIESYKREQTHEITENGDLWVSHKFEMLRLQGGIANYTRRPLIINIPPHGHFVESTLALLDDSVRAGVRLQPAQDYPARERAGRKFEYYWVNFPNGGLTRESPPLSYTFTHGCANCMTITHWEAEQRAKRDSEGGSIPQDFAKEAVGLRVTFPVRTLILKLKFPPSLANVQPQVECLHSPQYPRYKIDEWGDAEFNQGEMKSDTATQEEEQRELRYDAKTGTWILEVEWPIVGYQYLLSWPLRPDKINIEIEGNTIEWQRVLLGLGERIDARAITANDREAIRQFDLLCQALALEVCGTSPDEKWNVALFIYDSEALALRPVFSRRSWTSEELPRQFKIPYGDGVSGAAFQQRRIIAWTRGAVTSDPKGAAPSLITPVPYPDAEGESFEAVNVLALPVYQVGSEDGRRPPPWATIGVVTIDSSSYASRIQAMDDKQRLRLRAAAQAQMDSIVNAVKGARPAA